MPSYGPQYYSHFGSVNSCNVRDKYTFTQEKKIFFVQDSLTTISLLSHPKYVINLSDPLNPRYLLFWGKSSAIQMECKQMGARLSSRSLN